MATIESFRLQCRNLEADWTGALKKRFRWKHLRFEWGRYNYVVHPVEGIPDKTWWVWEKP